MLRYSYTTMHANMIYLADAKLILHSVHYFLHKKLYTREINRVPIFWTRQIWVLVLTCINYRWKTGRHETRHKTPIDKGAIGAILASAISSRNKRTNVLGLSWFTSWCCGVMSCVLCVVLVVTAIRVKISWRGSPSTSSCRFTRSRWELLQYCPTFLFGSPLTSYN